MNNSERQGWGLILISILLISVMGIVMSLFIDENSSPLTVLVLNAIFVTAGAIYLPSAIAAKKIGLDNEKTALAQGIGRILLCIAIGVGLFFAGTALSAFSNMLFTAMGADTALTNGVELPKLNFFSASICVIVVALMPAIAEEMMFRGIFERSLMKKGKRYSVLMSAAVFALFHMSAVSVLPIFAVGLVIGVVFFYTKSVVATFVVHFVYNLMGIVITLVQEAMPESAVEVELLSQEMLMSALCYLAIGVAILIPTLIVYVRSCKKSIVTLAPNAYITEADLKAASKPYMNALPELPEEGYLHSEKTIRITIFVLLIFYVVCDILLMFGKV